MREEQEAETGEPQRQDGLVVGGSREGHERLFESVERITETDCGYCMPYENGNGVFVLRGPRVPVAEDWPELKHYD